MYHKSVMLDEVIEYLDIQPFGNYLDLTLGGGGHSRYILDFLNREKGMLIGVDQDKEAIEYAKKRLQDYENFICMNYNFNNDKLWKKLNKFKGFDGILFDLGVSQHQLSEKSRGFSFQKKGPLDMRMGDNISLTAYDVVNKFGQKKLADIIYRYGEEKKSRKIAKKIVDNRPIKNTKQLQEIIESCFNSYEISTSNINVSTRTFQGIRIYINRELEVLEPALDKSINNLNVGGRLLVISYHSLEDRIVKNKFKKEKADCICPPELPVCKCDHSAKIKWVNKRVITPTDKEINENPSSRSAKLRVVERI